jgi:hypothetical protein
MGQPEQHLDVRVASRHVFTFLVPWDQSWDHPEAIISGVQRKEGLNDKRRRVNKLGRFLFRFTSLLFAQQ